MSWRNFFQGIFLGLIENGWILFIVLVFCIAPAFNACNETVRAFAPRGVVHEDVRAP